MGEFQVEQQSTVRGRVQAVCIHQHLQAETAGPIKPGGVHHACGTECRHRWGCRQGTQQGWLMESPDLILVMGTCIL